MALFGNFLYATEYYGERTRGDVPLALRNTGYWQDPQGRIFAKFELQIGQLDDRYPVGSQVVIAKGTSWYPDLPGRYGSSPDPEAGWVANDNSVILSTTVIEVDGVKVLDGVSGATTLTERDMPPVPINSVMYVRVFVREPMGNDDKGNPVPKPWDIRGSVYAVMAGNYGGVGAAISALPPTLYSGGDPFAEPDPESVTAKFISTLGFLADSVYTDGSLMLDGPTRIHPSMVMPLLHSFGLTKEEKAAFTDPLFSARLKSLLFAYRRIQASRGTAAALGELVRVLSGYEVDLIPGVENMLATLGDSSPGGVQLTRSGRAWACGFDVKSDLKNPYAPVCTLPWANGTPSWGDLWVTEMKGETQAAGVVDVWLDRWDQLDIPNDAAIPPRVINPAGDPWLSSEPYEQHVDWVHALTFTAANQTTSIGTRRSSSGVPLTDYCEAIGVQRWVRFRLRAYAGSSAKVTPVIVFVGNTGNLISESLAAPVTVAKGWVTVSIDGMRTPPGTRYIGWRIDVTSTAPGTVYLGALELRDVTLIGSEASRGAIMDDAADFDSDDVRFDQNNVAGVQLDWLEPYRNPRSAIVAVHTPWTDLLNPGTGPVVVTDDKRSKSFDALDIDIDGPSDTQFVFNYDHDYPNTFDSMLIPYDGVSVEPLAAVIATDVLLMRRLQRLLSDYVPHSVTARLIASWDDEYVVRFPERRVESPTPAAPGSRSLLTGLDQADFPLALS